MAQAYRSVPRGGGGGGWLISLIIFVLLCIALIAACTWLYLAMQDRDMAIKKINDSIRDQLDKPLRTAGLTLPRQPAIGNVGVEYGPQFFQGVREVAEKGIRYDPLVISLGWPEATVQEDVDNKLKGIDPPATDLFGLIMRVERRIIRLETLHNDALASLSDARAHAESLQAQLAKAGEQIQEQIEKDQNAFDKAKASWQGQIEQYKTDADDSNAAREKGVGNYQAEREARKRDGIALSSEIADLRKIIDDLERQLVAGQKKIKRIEYGKVLQTDPVERFVIVNAGKRDGMEMGDVLIVYGVGHAGTRHRKGAVKVVRVEPLVSRGDIIEQDDLYPIVAGDLVLAEKVAEKRAELTSGS